MAAAAGARAIASAAARAAPEALAKQRAVLSFWFGESPDPTQPIAKDLSRKWYMGGPSFDAECRAAFVDDVDLAVSGGLDSWKETAEGCVSLIVLLDQIPRNIFRLSPKPFTVCDPLALAVTEHAVAQGLDEAAAKLHPSYAAFLYHPYMHSENLEAQNKGVERFQWLLASLGDLPDEDPLKTMVGFNLKFAIKHQVVIERFGRFPHRNRVLCRDTTPEEQKALDNKEIFGA